MKKKKQNKTEMVIDADSSMNESVQSDVNGSYTGVPLDGGEPVQDADDL